MASGRCRPNCCWQAAVIIIGTVGEGAEDEEAVGVGLLLLLEVVGDQLEDLAHERLADLALHEHERAVHDREQPVLLELVVVERELLDGEGEVLVQAVFGGAVVQQTDERGEVVLDEGQEVGVLVALQHVGEELLDVLVHDAAEEVARLQVLRDAVAQVAQDLGGLLVELQLGKRGTVPGSCSAADIERGRGGSARRPGAAAAGRTR